MEHNLLTLDFWQDTVTYGEKTVPIGTLGTEALNISPELLQNLDKLCLPLSQFLSSLTVRPDGSLLPTVQANAEEIFTLLASVPPFSYQDIPFYKNAVRTTFTQDAERIFQLETEPPATGTSTASCAGTEKARLPRIGSWT